jgi:hypothetical protein
MRIEMIVFSGRRNPTWRLEPEDARGLQTALRKLPHVGGPLEAPERLGYCGMLVSNDDQTQPWRDVVVYHEIVVVRSRNRTDYLLDEERTVENLLLETAVDHVEEAVIDSIRAEPEAAGAG